MRQEHPVQTKERPSDHSRSEKERAWVEHLDNPEKQDTGERLLDALDAFQETYGTPGVRRITGRLKETGTITKTDIAKTIEEIPPLEEFRSQLLETLEALECLRNVKGTWIADLEKIKTLSRKKIGTEIHALLPGGKFDAYFEQGFPQAIQEALQDLRVISEEDWKRKERVSKPLFLQPKNTEDAFDPEEIRGIEGYLGYWDMVATGQPFPKEHSYPGLNGDASFHEVSIAIMIYHPQFGNGRRDQDGTLKVWHSEKQTFVPISKEWFTKVMRFEGGSKRKEKDSLNTPVDYLQTFGAHLQEHELLKPSDFVQQYRSGQEEKTGTGYTERIERILKDGQRSIMINGVLHYIGRKFGDGTHKIYEIAPGLGGVVKTDERGNEQLTHTFTIYSEGEAGTKKVRFGKKGLRDSAGAEATRVQSVEDTRLSGNSTALKEMKDRLTDMESFGQYLHLSNTLWREAKIRMPSMPLAEQAWISEASNHIDPNEQTRLVNIAKEYGADGVKAFLSMEVDPGLNADRIVELSKKLGPPLMRTVLKRYNDILRITSEQTEDILKTVLGAGKDRAIDIERKTLKHELLRRAASILKAADTASEDSNSLAEEILVSLDRYETDLLLFAAVFKTACKGRTDIHLEDFKALHLSIRKPTDIPESTMQEMVRIAKENWKNDPTIGTLPVDALVKKLQGTNSDSDFYLLEKDEDLLASMRFDHLPSGDLYAGSLNVNPVLRGSAIGEAFLNASLEQASENKTIRADFFPQIDAGMMYVDRLGWMIDGVESVHLDNGTPSERCTMTRYPARSFHLKARDPHMTKEYLIGLVDHDRGDIRVERFSFPRDQQRFLNVVKQQISAGMIVSRYFSDPANLNTRYVAFEPKPQAAEVQLAA